jgi:hypothetical protein
MGAFHPALRTMRACACCLTSRNSTMPLVTSLCGSPARAERPGTGCGTREMQLVSLARLFEHAVLGERVI